MTTLETLSRFSYIGEAFSLVAAVTWAVAVILFRISGRTVHPLGLNFFKCLLASILLIPTLLALGQTVLYPAPLKNYGLLALSGFIGIAVSDTLFLAGLNRLGAGLTAVVECLYSPFIIGLSLLYLGERLSLNRAMGVLLIIGAILIVSGLKPDKTISRKDLLLGMGLGSLAMLTTAVGIVMVKPLLAQVPVLWATSVRMAAGTLSLGIVVLVHPRREKILLPLFALSNWKAMVPAALLGSYVGLVAWMAGMKFTLASIAAPLNQLNVVFIFILAAVFLKEKVTTTKIAAVVVAFIGAFLASVP